MFARHRIEDFKIAIETIGQRAIKIPNDERIARLAWVAQTSSQTHHWHVLITQDFGVGRPITSLIAPILLSVRLHTADFKTVPS